MCIRIPTALLLVLVCGSASAATDGIPERVKSLGRWDRHDPVTLRAGYEPWSPEDAARLLELYQSAYLHLTYNDASPAGLNTVPRVAQRIDELQEIAASRGISVRGRLCLSDRPDVTLRLPDLAQSCSAHRGATGSCDWEGAMDGRHGEAEVVVKASGSAAGGTAVALADPTQVWTPALYRHRLAVLRPGQPDEERRRIVGNDSVSFEVGQPWASPPQPGDPYEIRGSFDTNWVMRAPREVHEATLRRFWEDRRICGDTPCRPAPFPLDPLHPGNPRGFLPWMDREAVSVLATAATVPALYGWGYDGDIAAPITEYSALPHQWSEPHFRANGVVLDLRNPAFRAWRARHAVYRLAEYGLAPGEGACLAVETKPGLHAWYDEAALGQAGTVCSAPNTNTYFGPSQICRDTQSIGAPLHPTQYGPGEFEAAISAYFRELVAALAENGYGDVQILTVEAPAFRNELWTTLADDVRRMPQMRGVEWGTIEPRLAVLGSAAPPPTAPPQAAPEAPPAESPPSWSLGGDDASGSASPITQTGESSWSDLPSASRSSTRGATGPRGDMKSGGGGSGGAAVEAPSLR
jgi:hypothetical protein